MFFTFVLGIVLFGTTVVIPQFLQLLLGYPAEKAGEAMAGGGFMMLLMMPIAGRLVSRVDPRAMMAFGFIATGVSLYYIATHINLQIDFGTAAMLRTYQTIGLAFIFLPSSILAYVGTPREKNNQISAMNSFVRNIGGSIGIALISTMLTRQAQKHQVYMSAHTVQSSATFQQLASGLTQTLAQKGVGHPQQQAYGRIAEMMTGQATTLAYVDIITVMAVVVVLLSPLVLLMRRPRPGGPAPAAH
jgi:DHA2 family multidrug resistance protein